MKIKYSAWQPGNIRPAVSGGYERRFKGVRDGWFFLNSAIYTTNFKCWLNHPRGIKLKLSAYQVPSYKDIEWQWRGLI